LKYIDIHTHTYYQDSETTLVVNVFPDEHEKFDLPVFFSVGLHPWHVQKNTWEKQVDKVKNAVLNNVKVLAVGEAGLDKVITNPYDTQKLAFNEQLAISETLKKPLIIHCVRSYSELLALRKKSDQSIPWIFHWFNSDEQIALELIRKNCYLSFGHMLFNEHSKAYSVFKNVPLAHVFFETDDAAYTIREVYAKATEIRSIMLTDLQTQIMNNFGRCFQF
jgi:TatD DNase family protein